MVARDKRPPIVTALTLLDDTSMSRGVRQERHAEVARLLALGFTQIKVAEMTGYQRRHIVRMANTASFIEKVNRIKAGLSSTLEADILANVSLAVQIERQMLAGDLPSTDKRYIEAKGIVKPIRERLIDVDRGREVAGE